MTRRVRPRRAAGRYLVGAARDVPRQSLVSWVAYKSGEWPPERQTTVEEYVDFMDSFLTEGEG